jgi:anti-sigma factor RsiW
LIGVQGACSVVRIVQLLILHGCKPGGSRFIPACGNIFQGKIPFSFNLPQNLPGDTTLDGANLTFLNGRPTAQLMYRIGKHRVSVFVQQSGGVVASSQRIDRSGFHVIESSAGELEIVAVSDVEASRLAELAGMIDSAQTGTQPQSR